MEFDVRSIIPYLWVAVGIVWLIGAFAVKQTARRQSPGSRLIQLALAAAGFMVGFSRSFRFPPLTRSFMRDSPALAYFGLAATATGIAFAIWARVWLGENWSGTVTVKQDHSLVKSGPYAIVRHPIYTGLLLALIGTIMVFNELRGLIALVLVLVMLLLKIRTEEQFMREQFSTEYAEYSQKVRALIPFVY